MKTMNKKKGQISLGQVPSIIIILITVGIVLSFGALFMGEMVTQADEMMNESNQDSAQVLGIMNNSIEGLETIGEWQPTIAVAVIIAVALSIVIGLFAFRGRSGGL